MSSHYAVKYIGAAYDVWPPDCFQDCWRIYLQGTWTEVFKEKSPRRKRILEKAKKMLNQEVIMETKSFATATCWNSLGCCVSAPTVVSHYNYAPPTMKEEKEKVMDTNEQKIRHLTQRLYGVAELKARDLRKHFNMDVDHEAAPKTLKELKEKFAAGYFIVDPEYSDDTEIERWQSLSAYLLFRDPTKRPDMDGYTKAEALRKTAYTEALDAIKILDPADGLKALREFESKTFH